MFYLQTSRKIRNRVIYRKFSIKLFTHSFKGDSFLKDMKKLGIRDEVSPGQHLLRKEPAGPGASGGLREPRETIRRGHVI